MLVAATANSLWPRLEAAFPAIDWDAIAGIEYWTQQRAAGSPLHMHWDVDEGLGRKCGTLSCPLVSVVCYLTSEGGPTLIIDQRPQDPWSRCVQHSLVWPVSGTVVAFSGDMLHGVLAETGQPTAAEPVRKTLILNIWAQRPHIVAPLQPADDLGEVIPMDPGTADNLPVPRRLATVRTLVDAATTQHEPGITSMSALSAAVVLEEKRLWLGMFDRSGELAVHLPPINAAARGFGADLVEFWQVVAFEELGDRPNVCSAASPPTSGDDDPWCCDAAYAGCLKPSIDAREPYQHFDIWICEEGPQCDWCICEACAAKGHDHHHTLVRCSRHHPGDLQTKCNLQLHE